MNTTDHDDNDVRLLLPWAATGRLSRQDMERVRALVQRSASAKAELDWWQSVSRDMRMESPEVAQAMQGDMGFARFRERLAATPQPAAPRAKAAVQKWLSFNWLKANWMAPALAASLCVVVVQGLMIEGVFAPAPGDITILSGPAASDGAQLSVAFQPQASDVAVRAVLADIQGEIVGGPSALGLYRIRVKMDVAEARTRLEKAQAVVADVAVLK